MINFGMTSQNAADGLKSSYHFDLPVELIAQRPEAVSRLLVYNMTTNQIIHDTFPNIGNYLPKDSLLVFNRSKVFPSRIFGKKSSGGKAELFLLSTEGIEGIYPALVKTTSKKSLGDQFRFAEEMVMTIKEIRSDGTFGVSFNILDLATYMEANAQIPIPPYIRKGESDSLDKIHYQTVYAREVGSVAAPTAGLHFTKELLFNLEKKEIKTGFVTLHVGLGTFRPVSTEDLVDHQMHSENYFFDLEFEQLLNETRAKKNKVFAVGTTSLRVLESSFNKNLESNKIHSTQIFLRPGNEIESIDGLITNFHLPESTLLMLVSTLIGREKALELYNLAIKEKYRFFSYGDGMLIIR